jgi:type I restriction enzyme S subunit
MTRWASASLSELGQIVTGSTPEVSKKNFDGGTLPFVTPADLDGTTAVRSAARALTPSGSSVVRLLPVGTVMVCCIGASLGKVGIAGVSVATNQQINSVIFDEERIWPLFGYYACQWLRPRLRKMAPATTLPIVNKSRFGKVKIPVPPLKEQKKIAALLDQANALRLKRLESQAVLRRLRRSAFHQLFGALESSCTRWPVTIFGDLAIETKIGLVRGAAEFGTGRAHPYVRMNAITRNQEIDVQTIQSTDATASEVREYSLNGGDFLFNTRNSKELVGKAAIWTGAKGCLFNNNIMRVRFGEEVEPQFILAAFGEPFMRKQLEARKSGTTSVFAIYWRDLKTVKVPVPPIELQAQFAARAAEIERLQGLSSEHIALCGQLFNSLQYEAFGA